MAIRPKKTRQTALVTWAQGKLAAGSVYVGTALDVSTIFAAAFKVKTGRLQATPNTATWPQVRVEASPVTSGDHEWYPLFTVTPAVGTNVAADSCGVDVNIGSTVLLALPNNSLISLGDVLMLGDGGGVTTFEVARTLLVSGANNVQTEEGVTYLHKAGSALSDQAELTITAVGLRSVMRVRAVVSNAGNGVTIASQVLCVTEDQAG